MWSAALAFILISDLAWGLTAPFRIKWLKRRFKSINWTWNVLIFIRMICIPYDSFVGMFQTFLFMLIRIVAKHVVSYASSDKASKVEAMIKRAMIENLLKSEAKTTKPRPRLIKPKPIKLTSDEPNSNPEHLSYYS